MGHQPVAPVRAIDGCPLPECEEASLLGKRLLDYWPVWDLQAVLEKDGIQINRAAFRPGWVKLRIDWFGTRDIWFGTVDRWPPDSKVVTAMAVRDIVAMAANEKQLYFNHWQVIRPASLNESAWTATLNTEAREAVVYFRTVMKRPPSAGELLTYLSKEEVNSIILASAFTLMEKEEVHEKS